MAQTTPLIEQLKKSLREAGKTYADVAKHLDLSEASVKRLFAQKNITLERLDTICEFIDLEITDLAKAMGESQGQVTQLTVEQELEIVSNAELLLMLWCLINHWTVEQVREFYNFEETDCVRLLAKLDRLKIIDLQPNNRVRLRLAPTFTWRDNGPILHFFRDCIEAEFFKSHFAEPTEQLICINSMMSESSNIRFQKRMHKLATEFTETCKDEAGLPLPARQGTTLVVAIRRWEYSSFKEFKRKRETNKRPAITNGSGASPRSS